MVAWMGLASFAPRPAQAAPEYAQQGAASAVGLWRVIDENSHRAISLIAVEQTSAGLAGKVLRVMHSEQGTQPKCLACPGPRRGQPVVGMTVLWDLKPADAPGVWEGGQVLDPAKGKIYRCTVKLLGNDRLQVRGFLGISLFGRTQIWQRAQPQELEAEVAPQVPKA